MKTLAELMGRLDLAKAAADGDPALVSALRGLEEALVDGALVRVDGRAQAVAEALINGCDDDNHPGGTA